MKVKILLVCGGIVLAFEASDEAIISLLVGNGEGVDHIIKACTIFHGASIEIEV